MANVIATMEPNEELVTFFPATVIRAETALSKFPVHNLSKTESIIIQIHRKGDVGEADVQWSVSPSREYGEPRQLAYKVDTLIVNRRIDEAGRPIPRIVRLGSFREICQELDLCPSGDNFAGLRTALLQNASAFITAKLTYKANEGGMKKFEAGFTRYSVVFTGEELPNGHRADAVYLFLNEHYWKLLNKAQFRPLDYDYQKSLKPAAHRFYELVSFPLYGCISRAQTEAKLLYSDFCLRAPQERYFDRARVQKQMYKVHKPHVDAEYLADVRYVKTVDAEGAPDWELYYKPGRRARAHFNFFTKNVVDDVTHTATLSFPASRGKRRKESKAPAVADLPALQELQDRGISPKAAAELLQLRMRDSQALLDVLEWGDHLIRQARPGTFKNPAGFYVYLVREGVKPPRDFEPSRLRNAHLRAQAHDEQERQWEQWQLEQAYEEYLDTEVDRYLREQLSPSQIADLKSEQKKDLRSQFGSMTPPQLEALAERVVRSEIRRRLSLEDFDTFCDTHRGQISRTAIQLSLV